MKEIFVFDLESGPVSPELLQQLKPKFTANKTLKDPDKIKADIEAKEREYIERAALDATTAQVLAIGMTSGLDTVSILFQQDMDGDRNKEVQLLSRFWLWLRGHLGEGNKVVGFAIKHFDLPMLLRRSFINGVAVPNIIQRGRYWNDNIIDLQELWCAGNREQTINLDRLSKVLGVGAKNGSGADFANLLATDKKLAIEYLTNDLSLTRKCAEKILACYE
jgi:predicted PolB exonuclease-like 3'-5' exonuclease